MSNGPTHSGDYLNHVLNNYAAAKRPPPKRDIESLLSILRRYNTPWEQESTQIDSYVPRLDISPSLPGRRGISIIKRLALSPFFYRLNFVRQLGLVHFGTNLDGSHTRLSHCIGTAQCAYHFLDIIGKQKTLSRPQQLAVLIGAFIHDCFHGPFGHSLEMVRDIFGVTPCRRLDKHFWLNAMQYPNSRLRATIDKVLSEEGVDAEERKIVSEYLKFFCDRDSFLTDHSWWSEYYLSEIINPDFDADRVDFVLRDSKHLGISLSPDSSELYGVIEAVRVLEAESPESPGKNLSRLCFSVKHKLTIDKFLERRRDLYMTYYESPEKLILDDMLAHVLYYALDAQQMTPEWWPSQHEILSNFVFELNRLTDDGLIHFIYEIGGGDPKSRHAIYLLNDLLAMNTFVEVHREVIRVSDADKLRQEMNGLDKEVEQQYEEALTQKYGTRRHREQVLSLNEKFAIVSSLLGAKRQEVLLLYFANLFSGGFHNKYEAEKQLWSLLLKNKEFVEIFRNYLFTKFTNWQRVETAVQDIPHVYITLPTYAATSPREIFEFATEPLGEEKLPYYDDDSVTFLPPDLPRPEALEKPIVIISACSFLAAHPPTKGIIVETFKRFFYRDLDWLKPTLLQDKKGMLTARL